MTDVELLAPDPASGVLAPLVLPTRPDGGPLALGPGAHSHVAVSGATGFIGQRLVASLLKAGISVTTIARTHAAVAGARPRVAALDDVHALTRALRGCDAVVHLAAVTIRAEIDACPKGAYAVNVLGTRSVLSAARAAGVGRIVLASTGKVYAPAGGPVDEDAPRVPTTTPGWYKLLAEREMSGLAGAMPGVSLTSLRIFNVYGPGQRAGFVIPRILEHLGHGDIALGNLEVCRDYVFVDDVVAAIAVVLRRAPAGFQAYNVGSAAPVTLRALVGELARAAGVSLSIRADPRQERPDEPALEHAVIERLRTVGWSPATSLARGLEAIVAESRAPALIGV